MLQHMSFLINVLLSNNRIHRIFASTYKVLLFQSSLRKSASSNYIFKLDVDMYAVYWCSVHYIKMEYLIWPVQMGCKLNLPFQILTSALFAQSILICHKQPMHQPLQMLAVAKTSCSTGNTDYLGQNDSSTCLATHTKRQLMQTSALFSNDHNDIRDKVLLFWRAMIVPWPSHSRGVTGLHIDPVGE